MKIISISLFAGIFSCCASSAIAKLPELPFSAVSSVVEQHSCFSEKEDAYEHFIEQSVDELAKARGRAASAKPILADLLKKRFSKERYQQVVNQFTCLQFTYRVDELDVQAYYLAKKALTEPSPAVIFNRGGNGDFGANTLFYLLNSQLMLADAGYVVLASQYREQDEFGGADLNDVIALVDIAKQNKLVDKQRISMFGVSRGGMMTYMAARKIPDLKTIIVWAGVTDAEAELAFRPEMERVYQARVPNYQHDKTAQLAKRSVLNWIDELNPNMPILLLHGDADKRVGVDNAKRLAEKLAKLNRPYHLSIYPDGDHGLRKYRKKAFSEIVEWLNQHG